MATGSSAATGSASSGVPSIAGLKFNPKSVGGWYYATDPNNSKFQIGYNPSKGVYDYSNPYTGQYDSGLKSFPTTLAGAVSDFEQRNGDAPLATVQAFLSGTGFVKATPVKAAPVASKTSTTSSGSTSATDPVDELLAALPTLLGDSSADPSSQSTQQPEVLPTTSGGATTSGSIVVPLLLIGVAIALGVFWYTHHKKKGAGAATGGDS